MSFEGHPGATPTQDAAKAAPGTPSATTAVVEIAAKRVGKDDGPWVVLVHADRIVLALLGGESHTISRSALGERLDVVPMGGSTMLTLKAEKVTLTLDAAAASALRRQLGADLTTWGLQFSLRETKSWLWSGLALGVVWFLSSTGVFLVVFAVANLIGGLGRLIRPGRWMFLLSGIRTVVLIVALAIDVFVLDAPWWFALFGLFFAMGANVALRRFAFFGPAGD